MDYLRELLQNHNIQGRIGEIGTDSGEGSTRILWDYIRNHGGNFFVVDTFLDEPKYQKVCKQLNDPKAKVFRGFSTEIAKQWSDPIDFLFIDGDHNFSNISPNGNQTGIMYDILAWHPNITVGGVMAFHDYRGTNEGYGETSLMAVEHAIDTLMNLPAYQFVGRKGSIISFKKIGNQLLNPIFKKKEISKSLKNIWSHIDEIACHTDTIIIYGTKGSAKLVYDSIKVRWQNDLPKFIFTDSFIKDKTVIFDGREVIPFHDLKNINAMFVVGSLFEKEIVANLQQCGKKHLEDYFTLFEFVSWCHLRQLVSF